jgi:hypothetical protein
MHNEVVQRTLFSSPEQIFSWGADLAKMIAHCCDLKRPADGVIFLGSKRSIRTKTGHFRDGTD